MRELEEEAEMRRRICAAGTDLEAKVLEAERIRGDSINMVVTEEAFGVGDAVAEEDDVTERPVACYSWLPFRR